MNEMKKLKLLGLAAMLVMAFACTEKETIYKYSDRTLVIVSDNNQATEMMTYIMGGVRAAYPDVEIHYFQTKPFDIKEASYLLVEAVENYPVGTYFAAIVEPGTNSERIIFETNGKRVLCPDNGVCSWTVNGNPAENYYFVDDPKVYMKSSDISFQDFYQFAILSMLSDKPLSGFGEICTSPVVYEIQNPVFENDTTKGEVIFVDNFGNCITNITQSELGNAAIGSLFSVVADDSEFEMTYGTTYSSVPVGENVCFINGNIRLEMSVNYGDLSSKYNIQAGTKVFLSKIR
jgi:S-adenosylmethionine hydrolase